MKMTAGSMWAITEAGLATLLMELRNGSRFASKAYAALAPINLGERPSRHVIVPVKGVLTNDAPWAGTTYGSIQDAAEKAAADPAVKSIVLAVDSPGGEVNGLPETAAVLANIARRKPVRAVVEGKAASAAYWLASQASEITVTPSGEVGSVGVRMMHVDMSKSLQDSGIKVTELSSGDFKTEWSPFQPVTAAAKQNMQERLDSAHSKFIQAVSQGRGRRASAHIMKARYGEGRMFDAVDALGHGLVDSVAAPRDFYRALAQGNAPEIPGSVKQLRALIDAERKRV